MCTFGKRILQLLASTYFTCPVGYLHTELSTPFYSRVVALERNLRYAT